MIWKANVKKEGAAGAGGMTSVVSHMAAKTIQTEKSSEKTADGEDDEEKKKGVETPEEEGEDKEREKQREKNGKKTHYPTTQKMNRERRRT